MTLAKQGTVGIAVSSKPAHVVFNGAIPLSSLIEPTMHNDHKGYNILKWVQHSQCWSASLRGFRLLFSAEAANPEAKHPSSTRSHATWLQKYCFCPSQVCFPAPWNHWLSHRHCDGHIPVMTGKGLGTQAGYEKKLASNGQFKLRDCTKMQWMLQEYSHSRDSASI